MKLLTIADVAYLLDEPVGTMRDRIVRQGRVKIHRKGRVTLLHILDVMNAAEELKRRDRRGRPSTAERLKGRL